MNGVLHCSIVLILGLYFIIFVSYYFDLQVEAIGKAVNNVESAVKEKHIRNIL